MSEEKMIPSKDTDFHIVQKRFVEMTGTHGTRWAVDQVWYSQSLVPAADKWTNTYQKYLDPIQRTGVITTAKNEARKELEPLLRQLIALLKANPLVNQEDKEALGLPLHNPKPTPSPTPTSYPEADIDSSVMRRLTIRFRDAGSDSKAKPHGVHGAEIRWGFIENPADVKIENLLHSEFDTRSPFTLSFTDDQRGKTIYFCLRWENTRGEKGPWGNITSAIVP